jgi:hypothetical protein
VNARRNRSGQSPIWRSAMQTDPEKSPPLSGCDKVAALG